MRGSSSRRYFALTANACVAVAVVLLVGGCGGTAATNSPVMPVSPAAATPLSQQAFLSVANRAADGVLLTTSDLPSGWTGSPHTPTPLTGFTGNCASLNPDDPVTGSSFNRSSDDFSGPGGDDALSQVDVFRTSAEASSSLSNLSSVIARCHDQFVTVFTQLFSKAGAAYAGDNDPAAQVTALHVSFNDVPSPTFGDASHSYRLAFEFIVNGKHVSGFTDAVFMRSGTLVADVTHTALDGDSALTDRLAQTVADRLVAAERLLTQ